MAKKYQVFVSSTYRDLTEERDQVIRAVLEMGHIPVGMEMFSAADEEQWKIIARQIDEIDYYALIVAHRYGSVTSEGVSYTEKEFDYATERGVPILGFIIDDSAAWPRDRCESDTEAQQRLARFKARVRTKLISSWTSKEDLHGKFSISLMKAITTNPRIGWVRADQATGADVTNELTRLSSENAQLRAEADRVRKRDEAQHDEVRSAIKVLSANSRYLRARTVEKKDWDEAEPRRVSLADVFHWVGKDLLGENSSDTLGGIIAFNLVGVRYLPKHAIGANIVSDILADLAALDLVEPSRRKRAVTDTSTYWTLTKLGRQVLTAFRRVRLEEGLGATETAAEQG